jgi:hypothetical protein
VNESRGGDQGNLEPIRGGRSRLYWPQDRSGITEAYPSPFRVPHHSIPTDTCHVDSKIALADVGMCVPPNLFERTTLMTAHPCGVWSTKDPRRKSERIQILVSMLPHVYPLVDREGGELHRIWQRSRDTRKVHGTCSLLLLDTLFRDTSGQERSQSFFF